MSGTSEVNKDFFFFLKLRAVTHFRLCLTLRLDVFPLTKKEVVGPFTTALVAVYGTGPCARIFPPVLAPPSIGAITVSSPGHLSPSGPAEAVAGERLVSWDPADLTSQPGLDVASGAPGRAFTSSPVACAPPLGGAGIGPRWSQARHLSAGYRTLCVDPSLGALLSAVGWDGGRSSLL